MKLTVGTSHGIYSGDVRLDRIGLKLELACRAVKIIIETNIIEILVNIKGGFNLDCKIDQGCKLSIDKIIIVIFTIIVYSNNDFKF